MAGLIGTSASIAICLEEILSPILRIKLEDGPINVIPFFSQASTKSGFSDKNP